MKKLDIIKKVEELLPISYHNATITYSIEQNPPINEEPTTQKEVPLFYFLENNFINFIYEDSKPESLVTYIENKLGSIIKQNHPIMIKVNEYIENNRFFKDIIEIAPNEVISIKEYLFEYSLKNMNESGYINYAGKLVTLDDLYLKLLNNEYHEPTLEDKAELCMDMVKYIDPEILDSVIEWPREKETIKITVRDYICQKLPTMMISATEVKIDSKIRPIDEVVAEVVRYQYEAILKEKEIALKQKEDEYNKTGDNPGLVGEIKLILKEDDNFEITTEIPTVASSLLTEEETVSLIDNYVKKESISDEIVFMHLLNNVKVAISHTNTIQNLKAKEEYFKGLSVQALSITPTVIIEALIASIEELITIKRNNIIKVANNKEEYIDTLFSEINTMTDELNNGTNLDDYSTLIGKLTERHLDALEKGIDDIQLQSSLHLLERRIKEKRLNLDSTIGYQSPEVERVKVELNAIMSDIKHDLLSIEHDPNNLGNLTGIEIRLNLNIERTIKRVEEEYNNGLLNENDREYYMNRLKSYAFAIQSETKIGYGIR